MKLVLFLLGLFFFRKSQLESTNPCQLDLLIMFDSGDLMSDNDMGQMRAFAARLANEFPINNTAVQVGFFAYNEVIQYIANFDTYPDYNSLKNGLLGFQYSTHNGPANTFLAFQQAQTMFNGQQSYGTRLFVNKGIILFTTGKYDGPDPLPTINQIRQDLNFLNLTMACIGINGAYSPNPAVNEANLKKWCGNNVFSQGDVFHLDRIAQVFQGCGSPVAATTTTTTTPTTTTPTPAPTTVTTPVKYCQYLDGIFILDGSGSMSNSFPLVLNFSAGLINSGSFQIGYDFVRFGAMVFSDTVTASFNLTAYTTQSSLVQALLNLPFNGGGTLAGEAFQLAQSMFDSQGRVPSSKYPKAIIFITDGGSSDDPCPYAQQIRSRWGTTIISVGTANADVTQLNCVSGDPNLVFTITDISALHSIEQKLLNSVQC